MVIRSRQEVLGMNWIHGRVLAVLFVAAVLLPGCATGPQIPDGAALKSGPFELELIDLRTGVNDTNYYVEVTLRNAGNAAATFDSGEVEILDTETGITYFSVSKDKADVSISGWSNVLTRISLEPGQATQGGILFQTPVRKATASSLKLIYNDSVVALQ